MWKNKTIPPKAPGHGLFGNATFRKHLGVCDVMHVCKCVGSMPCFTTNPVHTVLTATSGDQERHGINMCFLRSDFEVREQVTPLRNAKVLCIIIIFCLNEYLNKLLSLNWNLNWLTDRKTNIWCNKHFHLNEQLLMHLFRQTRALILM